MNEAISAFLEERIAAGDFPSAVYLVAENGEIVFQDALGNAVVEPERIPARLDTIYDLASLTKPLVTGLLAAQQIEDGEIGLEARLGDETTIFGDTAVAGLTVQQLVTHTSGLPAWLPLYLLARTPSAKDIAAVISEQKLAAEPQVEYSDPNFIALTFLIEGPRPDLEFDLEVVKRLGLKRTAFNPLSRDLDVREIAACELGNGHERQTCIEKFPELGISPSAFRENLVWGEVHDGNAYFMGGVSG
ncbi:MAG: serine hydrolase domain-containing protein, partial [Pyrinomonadaceae bacterium]|nr:serine hydrolase domain-containing protein [Pyrinomonadaceae bacterium]